MSEQDYKNIFAKNLKHYMTEQSVTQNDLAAYLHVSQSTISSWCNGEKMARMDKVQALAIYFNINKSDLLEDKDAHPDDTDAFRERMKQEYGVLFDLVDKASDSQRAIIEKILQEIVPDDPD